MCNADTHIAVVLGASGDIGSACADKLAEKGWSLVLIGRDTGRVQERISELGIGSHVREVLSADAEDTRSFHEMLMRVAMSLKRITGLVNAIGMRGHHWADLNHVRWEQTFSVNVTSAMVAMRLLEEPLAASGNGAIVNISSVAAREGYAKADYAASKAAMEALSRSAAVLLADRGIRVNCVAPGPVAGRMTQAWTEERMHRTLKRVPLRCLAEPEDVANAVAFLLSHEARHITGSVLDVHGGFGCQFVGDAD